MLGTNENNEKSKKNRAKGILCAYCGLSYQTIFVHGHEQCVFCKTNVEPCCSGHKLEFCGKE